MLCVSRSFTVASRVRNGSRNWNSGRCLVIGSFNASFPSSTSIAIASAVNALVVLMMPNSVCSSTAPGAPTRRTPYPLAKSTESLRTTATLRPGISQSRTPLVMYASSSLSCAARVCASSAGAVISAADTITRRVRRWLNMGSGLGEVLHRALKLQARHSRRAHERLEESAYCSSSERGQSSFSNRDIARSASNRPRVWHRAQ